MSEANRKNRPFSMNNNQQSIHLFNIGLINVCYLMNKVDYVVELLSEFNLDLLCLTETWLSGSDPDVVETALPATHELLHVPRPPGLGFRGRGSLSRVFPSSYWY